MSTTLAEGSRDSGRNFGIGHLNGVVTYHTYARNGYKSNNGFSGVTIFHPSIVALAYAESSWSAQEFGQQMGDECPDDEGEGEEAVSPDEPPAEVKVPEEQKGTGDGEKTEKLETEKEPKTPVAVAAPLPVDVAKKNEDKVCEEQPQEVPELMVQCEPEAEPEPEPTVAAPAPLPVVEPIKVEVCKAHEEEVAEDNEKTELETETPTQAVAPLIVDDSKEVNACKEPEMPEDTVKSEPEPETPSAVPPTIVESSEVKVCKVEGIEIKDKDKAEKVPEPPAPALLSIDEPDFCPF